VGVEELSLINTVPSAMAELVRLECLPASVRVVNLAGRTVAAALVQQLYEQSGIERVYDLYGPTEDTTYSTYALRQAEGAATIGRPIANTQIYLLDSGCNRCPLGWRESLPWRGGTGARLSEAAGVDGGEVYPNPYGGPGRGCTGRETWRAIRQTGSCSIWGAAISK
jgi:non-ribosomal peptide synthetase component F